jgi:hypothetical protein
MVALPLNRLVGICREQKDVAVKGWTIFFQKAAPGPGGGDAVDFVHALIELFRNVSKLLRIPCFLTIFLQVPDPAIEQRRFG